MSFFANMIHTIRNVFAAISYSTRMAYANRLSTVQALTMVFAVLTFITPPSSASIVFVAPIVFAWLAYGISLAVEHAIAYYRANYCAKNASAKPASTTMERVSNDFKEERAYINSLFANIESKHGEFMKSS